MNTVPEVGEVIYFGKIPSRGDFVKSRSGSRVLGMLDAWVTQGLERLSTNPAWKARYDNAPGVGFAFFAINRPSMLTGWIKPSSDASQRRFPFITAVASTNELPMRMAGRVPLRVADTWRSLEQMVELAITAEDPRSALDMLTTSPIAVAGDPTPADHAFDDFLADTSIEQLETLLRDAGHTMSLRQSVLSLGLLLSPLATASGGKPDKGLALPLPARPDMMAPVAALWMDLIAAFLARSDFELGLFVQRQETRPSLVLVFDGANLGVLSAMFGDDDGFLIDIRAAEWVEEYVKNDYAITKLSSYLDMPNLSIRQAVDTFKEAFLGV